MNSLRTIILAATITTLPIQHAYALDGMHYVVETQASVSDGSNTPFWLVNNRQGLTAVKSDFGYLRAGLFRDCDTTHLFSWSAGIDMLGGYGYDSPVMLHQLFGEARYRCLGLTIGMKAGIDSGVNNADLGSGNMLYSGNSRPIPQVRAGIPGYTPLPLTDGWLSVKGYVAYGFFTDGSWQRDHVPPKALRTERVLYHSKAMHLRVGDDSRSRVWAEGGLEMATQFGGISYSPKDTVRMPCGPRAFFKAFIPQAGSVGTPDSERLNVEGNHVGCWDTRIGCRVAEGVNLGLYYNHFFEDHSMMTFDYMWRDGLWGLEINLPEMAVASQIVYEYLYSRDQSGPVYWDHTPEIPEQVSGRDNYYNHGVYTGWQHWGMGIGNPLLISPVYNTDGVLYFRYNRVEAHHAGIKGQLRSDLAYKLLFTYSRTWGTYSMPLTEVKSITAWLAEITYSPARFDGLSGRLSLGLDRGSLLGDNCGMMITIKKTGWL